LLTVFLKDETVLVLIFLYIFPSQNGCFIFAAQPKQANTKAFYFTVLYCPINKGIAVGRVGEVFVLMILFTVLIGVMGFAVERHQPVKS